ncbi:MAG: Ig-like domain-containing protein [Gemmatimonadaceae bacterium]|nr:Ig-like domain-containing protein [Gemmatimonadaceae bacterium]
MSSVSVAPNGAALFTGGTQQFTATAKDASGATLSGQSFTWSSSATGVATVNSSGLMTAVGAGAVTITATSVSNNTKSGSASVTVSVQPTGSGTALTSGTAVTSLAGAAGDARLYRIDVPSGATNLNVQTTGGTGDVDLYVRSGQAPTFSVYTCKSTNPATAEQCQVSSPATGTWYILLQGFAAYSGVSLTATVTTSGGGGGGGGGAAGSVAQVSIGGVNACAVTTAGVGYCWGSGASGVVANGQAISSTFWYSPVLVSGNHTWRQIEVGTNHACGVTTGNELYCWGRNTSYGELGIGSTTGANFTTPQRVGAGMSFSAVTVGNTHSCALTTSGAAYCWGQNDAAQLGDGVTTGAPSVRSAPYAVAGGYTYTSIAVAGNRNTCAVRTGGTVLCWGDGQGGRLGRPYVLSSGDLSNRTPTPVSFVFTATSVAAGNSHFCAVGADGSVACWGSAQAGQLGRAGTPGETTYVPNIVTAASFTGVGGGSSHTCARAATNAIWCWGYNDMGQLGDGTTTNRPTPAAISGMTFKQAAANFSTSCGITITDALYCWGSGSYGVLGQGSYVGYSAVPLQVRFP